jgi:tetratricopeptide (TPR) repeat protein
MISGEPDYNSSKEKTKKSNKKKETVEIVEIAEAKPEKKPATHVVPKFTIALEESTNKNSIYYFKSIEERIIKFDTLISDEQLISLTKYKIHSNTINPTYLDSLANKVYQLNEAKKYTKAIEVAKAILIQSPNNLTGHKEISYAYKHSGNTDLANKHFIMMVKIIKSIVKYGDGGLKNPYILNNFFEGKSLYEAKFGCFPETTLVLTTDKRLLGTFRCFHINTLADLTHWLPLLKKEDYNIQK